MIVTIELIDVEEKNAVDWKWKLDREGAEPGTPSCAVAAANKLIELLEKLTKETAPATKLKLCEGG